MAWLESHGNLARHPKTRRLMRRMGWTLPSTIGNLHLLWWWALDFAPTGDLSRFEPEQLTYDLDLNGATPEQFIEAMIQAGFIDRSEDSLRLHDWPDYTAKSLRPKFRRNPERWHQVLRSYGLPIPPKRTHARPGTQSISRTSVQKQSATSIPATAGRNDQRVERGSNGAVGVDRVESSDATPDSTSQPNAVHAPAEPDPRLTSSPHGTASTVVLDLPSEQQRANMRQIRGEIPRSLSLVPGFADVWWLRLLEMYKNRGTPLDPNQRRELLSRLCMRPNSSVRLLKHCVENSLDCKWENLPNTS